MNASTSNPAGAGDPDLRPFEVSPLAMDPPYDIAPVDPADMDPKRFIDRRAAARRRAIEKALAGVELGDWDRRQILFVSRQWDGDEIGWLVSLLDRVRATSQADQP